MSSGGGAVREVTAFLETLDGTPPDAVTACRGWTTHEIIAHLNDCGITHIKRHNERFVVEYCDDCGAPLFADPTGEL